MKDERYKELMDQVGMSNSRSLLIELQQVENEVTQELTKKFQQNECNGCEFYGGMKVLCLLPSLKPCPRESQAPQGRTSGA